MNNFHAITGTYKLILETHSQQDKLIYEPICAYFEGKQSNKEAKKWKANSGAIKTTLSSFSNS